MAARNPDSMTNAQGEFHPRMPRSEPLEKSGHQMGQLVGNDTAPEFHTKVLPAGSAPASKTFKPNPENEIPGQANNPDASSEATGALDMPGATSADVHTGYGHPGQGQTGTELHNDGKHKREKERQGLQGLAEGGSGIHGDENAEARRLQNDHESGPASSRKHNISLDGAETKQPQTADDVAAMGDGSRKQDYDRTAEKPPGGDS